MSWEKPLREYSMEELAARQRSIKPSGGVLFARVSDREQKYAARERIVELFSPQAWPGRLHMLTMPGLEWRFERRLLGEREPGWMRRPHPRRTRFTSFENDRAVYYSAISTMPGLHTPNAYLRKLKQVSFAEMGFKTVCGAYFFANVDDMMVSEDWRDGSAWDAAWFDYTGPMTVKRLSLIEQFYQRKVSQILIVTVLKARWDRETVVAIKRAGGHSEWLHKHLPGSILHDMEYNDAAPMAQFAVRKSLKGGDGVAPSGPAKDKTQAECPLEEAGHQPEGCDQN